MVLDSENISKSDVRSTQTAAGLAARNVLAPKIWTIPRWSCLY